MSDIIYKTITASVRPHRLAILVDRNDHKWKSYVRNIITSFSKTWGGENFLIIPTDGKSIDAKFWEILESYSPDLIGKYIPTIMDLEFENPDAFERTKVAYYKRFEGVKTEVDVDKEWQRAARSSNLTTNFKLSDDLKTQLLNRLSPFDHGIHVIGLNLFNDSFVGYPFTDIKNISKTAKNPISRITLLPKLSEPLLDLYAISKTGALDDEYVDELRNEGMQVTLLPENKLFAWMDLVGGDFDDSSKSYFSMYSKDEKLTASNYESFLPFRNSMVNLARYYQTDIHRAHEEAYSLIVGDTVDDFCLYYSLSRLHDNVYWLPDRLLHLAHKKAQASLELEEKFSDSEQAVVSLVNRLFSNIRYGHSKNGYQLISHSLSFKSLVYRKKWINSLSVAAGFLSAISIRGYKDIDLKCIGRVFELNNYMNQQDMIFVNGESIGRINSPIPKNFTSIDPSSHYWVTNIVIEDYIYPSLPFLVEHVLTRIMPSYSYRISADGIAYHCPNVMYFGGDVDTNIVRPKLRLLTSEEIFDLYFAESGFKRSMSDKGGYINDNLLKIPSIEILSGLFKSKSMINILRQYLFTREECKEDDDICYLESDHRRYIRFNGFNKHLSSTNSTIELLDTLIESKILYRGLIFQCSNCKRMDWYGTDKFSTEFTCKRCQLAQPYTHSSWKWSAEPEWYYMLSETFYQMYFHNSHLTLLALNHEREASQRSFMFVTESDIYDKDGNKQEIDLLMISDGKIIIGECKTASPKPSYIRKYRQMFEDFKNKPHEFIVATTEDVITSDFEKELSKIPNSRVLLKQDLFSNE